ncbi:LolA-like putative outer membrane lipoprotein chaperone [Prevotella lacticifex]|nr:LolA-like putative outer membrane lipoprotein chaperone [Prevotella lacticifex]
MKKILFIIIAVIIWTGTANAQTARDVLDRTAATIARARNGASASFRISGQSYGNASGQIAIKGNRFYATSPGVKVWNDGKTQWTFTSSTNEVTVTKPNDAQQMSVNPYKFISIYKSGYRLSMRNVAGQYEVHMTAIHPARSLQEVYVTVTRNYYPTKIRMRRGKGWTTITISNFRIHKIADSTFQFKKSACPGAEIIDLR